MTTATLTRTAHSGRKAVRTDYVYTLTTTDSWNHSRNVFRTLRSAKHEAASGLTRPTVTKTGPNTWKVASTAAGDCATIITRSALLN